MILDEEICAYTADRGVHIIWQKPLAPTIEVGRRIVEHASAAVFASWWERVILQRPDPTCTESRDGRRASSFLADLGFTVTVRSREDGSDGLGWRVLLDKHGSHASFRIRANAKPAEWTAAVANAINAVDWRSRPAEWSAGDRSHRDGATLRRQPATAPAHDVRVNTTFQVEIS
jgi:hypothetical protein